MKAILVKLKPNRRAITSMMALAAVLAAGLVGGCSKTQRHLYSAMQDAPAAAQLKQFVDQKKLQAGGAANEAPPGWAPFLAAAEAGDWLTVSNSFNQLSQQRLHGTRWEAAKEILGAFEAFDEGDEKYAAAFGRDIVASIPPGSIYFGGTDPGRFVVTAMCRSQVDGDPFFVLTQNALADSTYLDYLRQMYGSKLYIPSPEDTQRCFQDYSADAQKRLQDHQLRPGEDVQMDASGHIRVSGQIAVMQINGLLARIIQDKNPDREVYLEESFPLDWMYPQLEPHGPIFKLNRQPSATLSDDVVQADHDYWAKYIQPMIGGWLTDETSVATVCSFAEKTFGRHDFTGFQGDRRFVENDYAHKMFSKLRTSIAGLYAWRAGQATSAVDKERMAASADLAFRQAWALCPYEPEAMYGYVSFLMGQNRVGEAIQIAETTSQLPPAKGDSQVKQLLMQLKRNR
jgi:outer membrane murein-binding lipoprotein Lpp